MNIEELVLQFDNVIPVKAVSVPMLDADGAMVKKTVFVEDYGEKQRILNAHGVSEGRMVIK